jgi:hypothetical protein
MRTAPCTGSLAHLLWTSLTGSSRPKEKPASRAPSKKEKAAGWPCEPFEYASLGRAGRCEEPELTEDEKRIASEHEDVRLSSGGHLRVSG